VIEDRPDTREGHPVHLLAVKLPLPLSDKDKKFVKESGMTVRLWLGPDGLPLAAETKMALKGRALLVISFETTETEEFRFAVIGHRLVVLRRAKETRSSGAGESNSRKSVATLSVDS